MPSTKIPSWVLVAVYTLFALQAIDCWETVFMTANAGAYELNPLMRWLLEIHPSLFAAVKLVLAGFGSGILAWGYGRTLGAARTVIKFSIWLLLAEYVVVVGSNTLGLVLYLSGRLN